METQHDEETSDRATKEFALHWISQRTGEWVDSMRAEDTYRHWLLGLIEEGGYTLPELFLLRNSMRFVLALDYVISGTGIIRRKVQSILHRSSYKKNDHLGQEIINRNHCRHSHLILSILNEAIEKEKAAHPSRRRVR